jgi:hypothetical protein
MSTNRKDVEEAAKLADRLADGISGGLLGALVPKRYKTWARSIANVLRDVVPLVPE